MTVDFHSHILPGVDDGSRTVAESVELLRMSAEQGIREVILTPHFYPQSNSIRRFLERRAVSMEQLVNATGINAELPGMRLGAEVYYFPQMSHADSLRDLAIEGTDSILIEMPQSPWTDRMYRELEDIYNNLGLTPIVAHVERYFGRFRDYGISERLRDLPVLVQSNASFVLRGNRALKMIRDHRIHLLGSDCHNLNDRKPNLGPACERIVEKLGAGAIEWICSNEREVLR